ncbi:MAG: 3-phosphoshikimate 1-carboxyvinyltransferase [Candidatus Bipolaricaulota bacterium]|nr:3-phosphoshikimate 1-carboxyvinyltransferase [Candidatus Bipolaricaulota bacterium]MBS3791622.1 3-phosphoshikimate 1-carboxyvinyltransferase [Candidatus Bipolaricaulota bacterium]
MSEKDVLTISHSEGNGLTGEMRLPGDKSISHRALLLGSLAEGKSTLAHLAPGEDVRSTINCLRELGVPLVEEEDKFVIGGQGLRGFAEPKEKLDAGNSGTLTRLIAGILATHPFKAEIDGDDSLRSRPMERIIDPLEAMGAKLDSREGSLPLVVTGGDLLGIEYRPRVASAQVKSSILLAGLGASGKTTVVEPGPSRDHTELMLEAMGYPISVDENRITVSGPHPLDPLELKVPGDFSSAGYFIAAACLIEGSQLTIRDVGLNETRTGFLELLTEMGASIELTNSEEHNGEPRGDLVVSRSDLTGVKMTEDQVVKSIDELPLLAVVATQAEGVTEVRGAEELRVKETDRIEATVTNLKNLGADIEELPDGFIVRGRNKLSGGLVKSFRDHRIAMSAAVAALVAEGETDLVEPEWVEISYPGFFETMEGLLHG